MFGTADQLGAIANRIDAPGCVEGLIQGQQAAVLHRCQSGDFFASCFQRVGKPLQEDRSLLGREPRPGTLVKCNPRCCNGSIHIGFDRFGNLGGKLSCVGCNDLDGRRRRGRMPFAAQEQILVLDHVVNTHVDCLVAAIGRQVPFRCRLRLQHGSGEKGPIARYRDDPIADLSGANSGSSDHWDWGQLQGHQSGASGLFCIHFNWLLVVFNPAWLHHSTAQHSPLKLFLTVHCFVTVVSTDLPGLSPGHFCSNRQDRMGRLGPFLTRRSFRLLFAIRRSQLA